MTDDQYKSLGFKCDSEGAYVFEFGCDRITLKESDSMYTLVCTRSDKSKIGELSFQRSESSYLVMSSMIRDAITKIILPNKKKLI
jgi:hypothetical protein